MHYAAYALLLDVHYYNIYERKTLPLCGVSYNIFICRVSVASARERREIAVNAAAAAAVAVQQR